MPPMLVAPASAASSRMRSTCAGESLMPGISGAMRTPRRDAGAVELGDRLQPRARARRVRLARAPGLLVERRDREVGADVGALVDLAEQVEVAEHERRLGEDRARVGEVAHRLPDAGHELVAALDPLVRIGVGPHRDVLALPRRPGELRAHDFGRVDLDDDLALEVAPGVEVEIGVGGAGEAVVAHHAVRDEVAGAGGDVVEALRDAKGLDRRDPQVGLGLDREAVDVALTRDRRIGRVEEPSFAQAGRPLRGRICRPLSLEVRSMMWSNPNASKHVVTQSTMTGSVFAIRSAPPAVQEPSASKMPARKPFRQSSLGLVWPPDHLTDALDLGSSWMCQWQREPFGRRRPSRKSRAPSLRRRARDNASIDAAPRDPRVPVGTCGPASPRRWASRMSAFRRTRPHE